MALLATTIVVTKTVVANDPNYSSIARDPTTPYVQQPVPFLQ